MLEQEPPFKKKEITRILFWFMNTFQYFAPKIITSPFFHQN